MTDEQAVRRIVVRIDQLWRAQRYDEIGVLLADDVVIAPPGTSTRVHGRDAYVQSYRDYDAAVTTREFEADAPQVDVAGDVAVAVCPFRLVYERDGTTHCERGRDLLVFARSAGAWRVAWRTVQTDGAERD